MLINPNKWYTTPEIVELNVAPVLGSIFKVKRYIKAGLLKGNTVGDGNGARYFVKGETLIQFLANWEDGSFH